MYFYPGKMKTHTRTFNKVRAPVFAERQLDLFLGLESGFAAAQKIGGSKSGSYVTPGQMLMGEHFAQNLVNSGTPGQSAMGGTKGQNS